MFRSALLILSGNTLFFVLVLARNLVVARLVSVEDYGIAATFAISMAIVEMMSDLGFQQMIVQNKDGNDPALQSSLQGFQVVRAVLSCVVLYFLAHPIARFLHVPEVAWAFQMLALVPILNGFMHFDIHRKIRTMNYLPTLSTRVLPALVSLLLVWPLFSMFGDYRVMLYAILAQVMLSVLISHFVADRPYRLSFDAVIIKRAFRFGWPLLANGILLFAVFHGEKLIVGRELGMAELAVFAMGFTLTLRPTLVLTSSAQSFFLPQLSAARDDGKLFTDLSMTILQFSLLSGALLVVFTVLFGTQIVDFLLGDKYGGLIPLLLWLAILQAFRAFKSGAAVVSVAQGKTSNATIANLFRVASMPVSWYIAATSGNIFLVVLVATIGESCGYIVSLVLLKNRLKLNLRAMIWPVVSILALLAFAAINGPIPGGSGPPLSPAVHFGGLLLIFALAIFSMKNLRRYAYRRVVLHHLD